ncbi:hypothetical protein L0668_14720 [Paraglaciecola aquimarina]|uniref:Uncharacterized protein n=1 Tax=Paraglaciecola algarum TaxID=3050085 RepID=A0ABS9D8V0_9ALTE|nr:hypothetical protein [Paraglaciecola sp. G1-23]MCF2949370.1 hypothetical protein [Paraglaciecola sp. G1-23]
MTVIVDLTQYFFGCLTKYLLDKYGTALAGPQGETLITWTPILIIFVGNADAFDFPPHIQNFPNNAKINWGNWQDAN